METKLYAIMSSEINPIVNVKMCSAIFVFGANIISQCIYMWCEAQTIEEFTNSFYGRLTAFVLCFELLNHRWTA